MKTAFKIAEIINVIALMFLLLGFYGLPVTGFLQVLAALIFICAFPKNQLIYVYFALVVFFFLIWDGHTLGWIFALPIFLIVFLTVIIYKQKKLNNEFFKSTME